MTFIFASPSSKAFLYLASSWKDLHFKGFLKWIWRDVYFQGFFFFPAFAALNVCGEEIINRNHTGKAQITNFCSCKCEESGSSASDTEILTLTVRLGGSPGAGGA